MASDQTATEPTQLDRDLIAMFETEARRRNAVVDTVLAAMTERERRLVREVIVMANVRALPSGERPAKDSLVVADVISACLSMDDLYPTIAALLAGRTWRSRGTCPHCGRSVQMRNDGTMTRHQPVGAPRYGKSCPGSRLKPKGAAA